ncbi:MAG: glycosyltransferase family 4 protein [Acidimicrobiaceae bacterium]|nr:glycosyltransferase family 4 protein [Acidimicrobiaceae bacterium]MBO0747738.1 glycosyltransferase family 4 protein [Acidimicrobiaceae bacterium]
MRVFLWHVHGSWTTAFVQGPHTYLVPVLPDRGPDGRGRAQTWTWPATVEEVTPAEAAQADFDVMVLQRPEELHGLAAAWTGRRPGRDVAAVYLEHNAPDGPVNGMVHPAADRPDLSVVHVTHFNQAFWHTGATRSVVIEHGIIDPGYRYQGSLPRAAAVINDPGSRTRATGADLLEEFRRAAPVDLFGMRSERQGGADLPQARLFDAMAARRVYLHPNRWTSLGLSLIEAMTLGMPVVALAATEVPEAVPSGAGVVSTRVSTLTAGLIRLVNEPDEARAMGRLARQGALERFGLGRFLDDWDRLLKEAVG